MFTLILILSVLILAGGLWWTLQLAKKQKSYTKDEINPAVARHTALFNPVFLTYIGFTVVVIVIIYIAYFVY
ncbi:hypothetical protein [Fictibacillus barbaricus]|uniref:Short-chain dehydrogenase n=1 Tax=Fictibacillus barbaricus TaxID=182136 RepID=A0ABU1TXG4_9BACL|nr:hypothetical protein [Fictibacillus barbaricus]MDR7071895.1 hypothetical protein [Fictibacillus barbaricus]